MNIPCVRGSRTHTRYIHSTPSSSRPPLLSAKSSAVLSFFPQREMALWIPSAGWLSVLFIYIIIDRSYSIYLSIYLSRTPRDASGRYRSSSGRLGTLSIQLRTPRARLRARGKKERSLGLLRKFSMMTTQAHVTPRARLRARGRGRRQRGRGPVRSTRYRRWRCRTHPNLFGWTKEHGLRPRHT